MSMNINSTFHNPIRIFELYESDFNHHHIQQSSYNNWQWVRKVSKLSIRRLCIDR